MKKIFGVLLLGLLFISNTLVAKPIKNINEAVNEAGRQRMLTQNIMKNYTLLTIKRRSNVLKEYKKSIKTFEENLKELSKFTQKNHYKLNNDNIVKAWSKIKNILISERDSKEIENLVLELDNLLKISNKYVQDLVKESGTFSSHIINISGRQRMLSQKLASIYMLKAIGTPKSFYEPRLESTMSLFSESHMELSSLNENNEKIKDMLLEVETSFKYFEELTSNSEDLQMPIFINKQAKKILRTMNKITAEYVKILK